jgi:hypothetical protein
MFFEFGSFSSLEIGSMPPSSNAGQWQKATVSSVIMRGNHRHSAVGCAGSVFLDQVFNTFHEIFTTAL